MCLIASDTCFAYLFHRVELASPLDVLKRLEGWRGSSGFLTDPPLALLVMPCELLVFVAP